jgi:orotate phosphoribosyltransferase
MDKFKEDFIDFLLDTNSLKVGGDFTLKSKRLSPYFVNVGDFSDGNSVGVLGKAYASAIKSEGLDCDILFGPSYKGIPLAVTTAIALAQQGVNVGFTFDRKEAKDHGEVTNKSDLQKAILVGKKIQDGANVIMLDDVFTTGDTKYETIDLINKMANNVNYKGVVIAVDRQEAGINDASAIGEFVEKTGIPVPAIVTTSEIYEHLKTKPELDQTAIDRIALYLRVYGTDAAREHISKFLNPAYQRIIKQNRSVIPACDVEVIEHFEEIVKQTHDLKDISAYKIGFELGLYYGLPAIVKVARKYTDKPLIYDHQKAGSDIPDTGKNFARVMKKSGIDTVILFPQAGPETEKSWIYHALDYGLNVIVGGRMTHPAYAQSEGGFISDEGAMRMYRIAARAGVNNFVVPGNKPDVIREVKEMVEAEGVNPTFYAPGFVAQGGKIEDTTKVAGDKWHAIVGRGITEAKDIRKAAEELTSKL